MIIRKTILLLSILCTFVYSQSNSNKFDIAINTINEINLKDKDFEDAFDDLIYTALNKFTQQANQFSWSKSFNLTRPEDVPMLLKEQQNAEKLAECSEDECDILFGVIVQADYIIKRTISDFPGGYKVFLDFKNISTGLSLGSENAVIRTTGADKIEIYENIEKELLNLIIDMFNFAFKSEPRIPKATFMGKDIGVIDGPTIQPVTKQIKHGEKLNIRLTALDQNNTLNEPREFIFFLVEPPKYGTAFIDNDILSFTPEQGWTGDVVLKYYAQVIRNGKPSLNSNIAQIIISVVNDAPKARDSSQSVKENGRKVFNLSASDADNDKLTYRITSQPTKGKLTINNTILGRVTYVPFDDIEGSDSFSFIVNDGLVDSNIATVDIVIDPIRTPPTVDGFSVSTLHDQNISFFLRGYDNDGDNISYKIAKYPSNGRIDIQKNKVTYRPNEEFYGQDEIFYFVEDEYGLTSTREKVTINVTNSKPTGFDYTLSANIDQSIKVELRGADNDKLDVVKLAYIVEKSPSFGNFKRDRNSRNVYTYTPYNNFTGPDQIAYRIYDGAQFSDVHVITINVKNPNITSTITQTPTRSPKPKQTRTPVQKPSSDNKKDDDGGSNFGMILGVLLLVVILAAAGGGGGGGSDPTGGVDIGITIP